MTVIDSIQNFIGGPNRVAMREQADAIKATKAELRSARQRIAEARAAYVEAAGRTRSLRDKKTELEARLRAKQAEYRALAGSAVLDGRSDPDAEAAALAEITRVEAAIANLAEDRLRPALAEDVRANWVSWHDEYVVVPGLEGRLAAQIALLERLSQGSPAAFAEYSQLQRELQQEEPA